MKKLITLLSFMIFIMASPGYAYQNKLTISSNSNSNLRIQIDGRFYQVNKNDAEITISDQRPGNRTIKVYAQKNSGRGGQGNNERSMQLLYHGNLLIRDGYHTDVIINRFGKAFIDENPMARYSEDFDNENNWNSGNDWSNSNGRQAMNERSFLQLKQTLSRESFDDRKISISKAVLANNYLSSYQVKNLLSLLNFETSKLELAKYCYRFTTDPGNYYVVGDGLTYNSSKTELMRYIQQSR